MTSMEVTLLYCDSYPHWRAAEELLERLAREHPDVTVHRQVVDTDQDAERFGFIGSPTILIDGVDPQAPTGEPVGLSCRMFTTPDELSGCPTWDQLEAEVASRRHRTEPPRRSARITGTG